MTDLSKAMLALAETGVPEAAELREKAEAFDRATDAAYAENGTKDDAKRMLGAWARARKLYCSVSGEALV